MQRLLFGVQYNGTNHSGWARNADAKLPSVMSVLDDTFENILGPLSYSNFRGSSRTDAGVHALRNTFQIDLCKNQRFKNADPVILHRSLNSYLCKNYPSVRLIDVREVPHNFDCRLDAISRTYIYRIICPREKFLPLTNGNAAIFHSNTAYFTSISIDVDKMRRGSTHLIGEMNFSTFRSSTCQSSSPIRHIKEITITSSQLELGDTTRDSGYNLTNLLVSNTKSNRRTHLLTSPSLSLSHDRTATCAS